MLQRTLVFHLKANPTCIGAILLKARHIGKFC